MRISDVGSDVCSSDLAAIDAVVPAEAALAIIAVAIMVVGVPAAATSAAIAVVIAIAGRGAAAGKGGRGDERGEQDFVHRISPCGASDKRPASGDGVPGGGGDAVWQRRTEERRVGKARGRTWRHRWEPERKK